MVHQTLWFNAPAGLTGQVLERRGCPLHYWIGGAEGRPLVVLTHGATVDHRMFNAQLPALLPEYRVLVWDMRGHGQSQPRGEDFTVPGAVDDLLAILDHLGVQQAVIGGQSTGTYVAQELVFRHPERVRALVIIDGTCITGPLSWWERLMVSISPAMMKMYPAELLIRQMVKVSSIREEVRDYLYEAASLIGKEGVINVMTGLTTCLHPEPDYHIEAPLLLVHGDQDRLGNIAKIAPWWAKREKDCRYVVIPNAGHCSNQDNPEFFNRVLLDFLHERVPVN